MKQAIKEYIGDRAFYRAVLLVTLPIMVQNFITHFVNMLDNIMVGSLGTEQMSAVAIVNQILFVYNLTIFGAVGGVGIFTAQFYGKGDEDGIRHTLRLKLIASVLLTVIGIAVIVLFGDGLITLFLHQGDYEGDLTLTFELARQYLAVMVWQLPFFMLSQCIASTMRETGSTVLPMVAGLAAVAVNFAFNLILIFGYLGFPALGVIGAAIATVMSRVVEVGVLVVYVMRHLPKFAYCRRLLSRVAVPRALLVDVLKKGTPLLMNECFWSAGMTLLSISYSLHGIDVVAAYSITSTVTNLFNISFMALGVGAGIMVGNLLGENRFEEAVSAVKKLLLVSVAVSLTVSVFSIGMSGFIVRFFKTSDASKALATYFIRISALFVPMVSIVHTTYFTIRSGGKSFITFLFDSVFVCLLQVPLAFALYYVAGLNIHTIYPIILSCDVIQVVIGLILLKKRIWVHNIVQS